MQRSRKTRRSARPPAEESRELLDILLLMMKNLDEATATTKAKPQ